MRGKAQALADNFGVSRITPAYAGKSQVSAPAAVPARDHPRLCGEKIFRFPSDGEITGSPPPMRGKVPLVTSIAIVMGITPAYAGKRIWEARA